MVQTIFTICFSFLCIFMQKTLANVKENPHAAIYLYDSESKKCLQVKGKIEVKTSGEEYEKMKKRVHEKNQVFRQNPCFCHEDNRSL